MAESLNFHSKLKGKIKVSSKIKLTQESLLLAYTPGVARVSSEIAKNKNLVKKYTGRQNTVAIVTDGSAVLGLGDIGPEAALPVMEGKAAIFSQFAGINAFPICLDTKDPDEIVETVLRIAPAFGGINLEDIAAPKCFFVLKELEKKLPIPVFHDDQDGTAIVVLAGLINALKITDKNKEAKIVISGAGAAGIAIARLLEAYGLKNYCLCDSVGTISDCRTDIKGHKKTIMKKSQAICPCGKCSEAMVGADVLIGVSKPNQFKAQDIKRMNADPIVFALANPVPEIMPSEAKKGGAKIIATGRSDFPNQINNALVFPGLFRGLLDNDINKTSIKTMISVAEAIASLVKKPNTEKIIPSLFDKNLVKVVSDAVKKSR
ncbi:NADP-dependent malic enzyme [Patescibacteria group bacterium]|nr:NADP-dependent malic enzyme [Patescibacteria group bacterium]